MSVQNGERLVTKQDLADFYNNILPYMGGIVTSKAGFTPIGTIISVMGTTAPVNYLACDGTVYNIADYVELANYFNEQFGSKNFFGGDGTTTFAVPDLRGEFLRGTGTNSHTNQGSGASVGEHQDATEIPQIWNYQNSISLMKDKDAGGGETNIQKNVDKKINVQAHGTVNVSGTNISNNDGARYTSRPTNTSVLYCIATKNFYIDPTLDYSTEEKIVGTWIDGKQLYQKTIVGKTNSSINSWKTISTISNMDIGMVVGGYVLAGNYVPIQYAGYGSAVVITANGEINHFTDNSSLLDKDIYVTVQYTKAN